MFDRVKSYRVFDRVKSYREFNRVKSYREFNRVKSYREFDRVKSYREFNRVKSYREFNRVNSYREFNKVKSCCLFCVRMSPSHYVYLLSLAQPANNVLSRLLVLIANSQSLCNGTQAYKQIQM